MPLSLECWGKEWVWHDCENISVPELPHFKVTLTPYSHNSVRLKLAPSNFQQSGGILEPSFEIFSKEALSSDVYENATMGEKQIDDETRVTYTHLSEDEALIVNDVIPHQIYRITLAPHKQGNASTIFFRINDTSSDATLSRPNARIIDADFLVKAEEISLVVLILILWMVAIALFVHRWGKIRMLEPYQPDYKAIHEPNCPLNPSTSPTLVTQQSITSPRVRAPTFKSLPRKSSSLCFTPSMLRTAPKSCPIQSRYALHRRRGRMSTDYGTQKFVHVSELCRKARSAENLRHTKITISPERSVDEGEESSRGVNENKSSSLENCRGSRCQSVSGVELRGTSLDSASHRRASSATPWWNYSMGTSGSHAEGITTPEIRISPTPPETTTHHIHSYGRTKEGLTHSHSCLHSRPPGIQRQDPLDETLLPPPYATLLEEENEIEDVAGAAASESRPNSDNQARQASRQSQESLLSQDIATGYSSQESQDSQYSIKSHKNFLSYPFNCKRDIKFPGASKASKSGPEFINSPNYKDGTRDTSV